VRSRPPRHLLLTTLLALILCGNANAEGEAPEEAPPFTVLANVTISCSAAWPSTTIGCFIERPVFVLGGLELAVGLDAQAVITGGLDAAHLAPYGILAYYAGTWSAWLEAQLPELASIPTIGSPDWLRAGFTLRIPP